SRAGYRGPASGLYHIDEPWFRSSGTAGRSSSERDSPAWPCVETTPEEPHAEPESLRASGTTLIPPNRNQVCGPRRFFLSLSCSSKKRFSATALLCSVS